VWAKKIRATAIHFQPVDRWTPETFNELWIDDPQDRADLRAVRDDQIAQKRKGAAILKSKLLLRAWDEHFLSQPAPDEYRPCRVGMRNYFNSPRSRGRGLLALQAIGNVRTSTAQEIWYGAEARKRRKETVACDALCLFTCLSQKSLTDKANGVGFDFRE